MHMTLYITKLLRKAAIRYTRTHQSDLNNNLSKVMIVSFVKYLSHLGLLDLIRRSHLQSKLL